VDKNMRYPISSFGEFVDKSVESEFLVQSLSSSSKNTAQVVLAFGIIFTLFLGNDYLAIVNTYSLVLITAIKVVFLILSTAIFLYSKHITEHRRLIYLINAYDIYMGLGFLFILKQYESLSYSSVFETI
jgi:hypothetical protein